MLAKANDSMTVSPPKQARSQRTVDRVLQATRELLYEKEFSDIAVAEILRRSETSAGAFYARFPSKEALLPALYDAYSQGLPGEETVWADPATWGERSLAVRVEKFVRFVIRDYRATRSFMRPLAIYARQHPAEISAASRHFSGEKHRASRAYILDCREEIGHPDPERAVDLITYFVPAIGRDKVLFGDAPHANSVVIDDLYLEDELIRMALAYLRGEGEVPR